MDTTTVLSNHKGIGQLVNGMQLTIVAIGKETVNIVSCVQLNIVLDKIQLNYKSAVK